LLAQGERMSDVQTEQVNLLEVS